MGTFAPEISTTVSNFSFERVILSEQNYIRQTVSGRAEIWGRENLTLNKGKPLHINQGISQMLLQKHASTQGSGHTVKIYQ